MPHRVLRTVLDAQRINATLSGRDLRVVAENLIPFASKGTVVKAFDATGERIIGAALVLSDALSPWDYTAPMPTGSTCVLVGGLVAGPAAIGAATQAALDAGATRIEVAIIGGWTSPIEGVARIWQIGLRPVRVA